MLLHTVPHTFWHDLYMQTCRPSSRIPYYTQCSNTCRVTQSVRSEVHETHEHTASPTRIFSQSPGWCSITEGGQGDRWSLAPDTHTHHTEPSGWIYVIVIPVWPPRVYVCVCVSLGCLSYVDPDLRQNSCTNIDSISHWQRHTHIYIYIHTHTLLEHEREK